MIAAGFGCRAAAGAGSLEAALRLALAAAGCQAGLPLSLRDIDVMAAPADRAAAGKALAAALGLRFIAMDGERIAGQPTATDSAHSRRWRGAGSVAEAAALAAAGPGARLLAVRQVSPDGLATCAIAAGGEG